MGSAPGMQSGPLWRSSLPLLPALPWLICALLLWLPAGLQAQAPRPRASATPQRPTFTADTSTTAPGTLELEAGAALSGDAWSVPLSWKYAPGALRNSEFSLSFDTFTAVSPNGKTVRQFGNQLVAGFRRAVYRDGPLSLAVAPRVAVFLRDNDGARLGFTGIMAYEFGQNAVVVNAGGSAATHAAPGNPRGLFEADCDFSRALGASGHWSRLAVFAGIHTDKGSRQGAALALGQGLAYRLRPDIVLDVAVFQSGLAAGPRDYQFVAGITMNLGRFPRE